MDTTVIQDKIQQFLGKYCSVEAQANLAGKYIATFSFIRCNEDCWTLAACGLELPAITYTREAVPLVSSGADACSTDSDNALSWTEYTSSTTVNAESVEFTLDFAPNMLSTLDAIFRSGERVSFCIELNDNVKTQFSFAGLILTSPTLVVGDRTSTDLTSMTIMIQPVGEYYRSESEELYYCD